MIKEPPPIPEAAARPMTIASKKEPYHSISCIGNSSLCTQRLSSLQMKKEEKQSESILQDSWPNVFSS